MTTDPAALHAPTRGPGRVDYRLLREATLTGVRQGRISRADACDAHPELLRAARSYSEETSEPCPLCGDGPLVLVRYVFGPRLPPNGRCVATNGDWDRIRRRKGDFTCYVVEVCSDCSWNHLRFRFGVAGAR
ncbi:MAG: DUF5318 family protein [Acidimicrobiia bacterium]|nr:DUF5318 family protein [Acidimicrobiia bacterium]